MTDGLLEARKTETRARDELEKNPALSEQRPAFHFSTPVGWCNDPNGFSFFGGKIHLFYQYHPYSTKWGPMHWGHVTSKDMLVWDAELVALAPDSPADSEGCFSGTALDDGGKHVIAYTGVSAENGKLVQNQCIAVGDGKTYVKSGLNPVITSRDVPFEYDREHFRDPKIWRDGESGLFFMVCAIKQKNGRGALVMFSSENLESWKFGNIVDATKTDLCGMWECPDVFSLDGKDVVILSPQDMKENPGLGFHDGNNVVYMTGNLDPRTHVFERDERSENGFTAAQVDYGIDFYAPETTLLPDGRRVMVGWMQSWESYITPQEFSWSGMMTLPRVIGLRDGRLFQNPVEEIRNLYGREISGSIKGGEKFFVLEGSPRLLDVEFTLPECGAGETLEFRIGTEDDFVLLGFDAGKKSLFFDRSRTRFPGAVARREFLLRTELPSMKFRIVLDRFSAEVFVNDGESAFTNCFFLDSPESDFIVESCLKGDVCFTGHLLDAPQCHS